MNRLKPLIRKTFSISLPIAKVLLHKASKVFVQQSRSVMLGVAVTQLPERF